MNKSDVAVVGGGVIGLAAAWRLRARGLSVALIDERPGRGASWAAAGMLAPITEVHYGEEDLLQLNLASARRYPEFVDELESVSGTSVGYRRSGTIMVARDSDENEALGELWRFQRQMGLPAERLRARECRRLEPGLSPRVRGGILVESDHQIDNRALISALLVACRKSGVRFVEEPVASVELDGARPRARVASGTIETDIVVLSAGAMSGNLAGLPRNLVPVRPVKGQLLHLSGPPGSDVSGRNVRGLDVYAVPRGDGRLVVGATVEERGFDHTVTAGGVYELLRDAYELLPGITELEFEEVTSGLRPTTPDNAPLIGKTAVEGLLCATGHFRNGILLAPITAEAIAELCATGRELEEVRPFSAQRFDARAGAKT